MRSIHSVLVNGSPGMMSIATSTAIDVPSIFPGGLRRPFRRPQAEAEVAARSLKVETAVGMMDQVLPDLSPQQVVQIDEEHPDSIEPENAV